MALICCDECGKMVSEKAINCPQCGNPISNISALSSESKPNFEKSNSGCFYCKIHEADQKKSFSKKMYKLTGVSELIIGRSSNFLIKNVEIPRFRYCCKKHENFYFYVYIPIFITSIMLIARFLFYDVGGWDWTWAIIVSVMFSFFCAAGITFILSLLLFRLIFGIPLDDNVNDHPIVVSLVENGWRTSKPNPQTVTKKDIPEDILSRREFVRDLKKSIDQIKKEKSDKN